MMQPTRARFEQVAPGDEGTTKSGAAFAPVPSKMSRNFYITDTYYESSQAGIISAADNQAESADFLQSFNGLSAVSDDIKDLLPPECRKAFDQTVEKETTFRSQWGLEGDNTARLQPVIDKAIVPYSMT
jgi:chromatin structure-remodeling complex protein RSC7